ncbi:TPA: DUF2971 domain-containing protein [Vibrio vulnificus]|uniref:DUF2971 domain-containing protein n=1 Tax=Vibrio vulnificus TaxID=672 RepID=UPI001A2A4562|nr:DUF2971 domain-containing protein [Vibrio vulnificus]MCA0781392.1 DUF2971 domain-containing protein [Vibrio vulnificus]HAS6222281.1 DUF2971 domain-containing protein [Vibrio vulnificus]HAS6299998.1 DUF2971 domain-containing protein [Vibrio vulnificus]HAT8530731.1 DUF2971 domain-containing protein [Vibrio vulnificus]HDY7433918.1 DUF2971 domain-containing protein [Vibrio vulnificus]
MTKGDTLYHYSNISGVHGILTSGCLWATDYRYLNDTNELSIAIESLINSCEESWREALNWGLRYHSSSRSHFVISFSKSPKVLSQWRAYANDGKGAAIGFRTTCLERNFIKNTKASLVECKYFDHSAEIETIAHKHKATLELLVNLFRENRAINAFMEKVESEYIQLDYLFDDLLSVKNEAFAEEQEVRLVLHAPKKEVKLRSTENLIIPYIEHHFIPKDDRPMLRYAVNEIWLGPKCDLRNKESFEHYDGLVRYTSDIQVYDCGYK